MACLEVYCLSQSLYYVCLEHYPPCTFCLYALRARCCASFLLCSLYPRSQVYGSSSPSILFSTSSALSPGNHRAITLSLVFSETRMCESMVNCRYGLNINIYFLYSIYMLWVYSYESGMVIYPKST